MRTPSVDATSTVETTLDWYASAARSLPWRDPATSAWGVLVSEFMCQQTQVDRVVPRWTAWMQRWPRPSDLAAAPQSEAIRAWDRLGYPRRARWLHQAATVIATDHADEVPDDADALRALPGVGEYTAAAVQAFAFGQPSVVLDTNVRRVIGRAVAGFAHPGPSISVAERALAADLVTAGVASRGVNWSQAVMELGALVCTAKRPSCERCPVAEFCAWRAAGHPEPEHTPRRQAKFEGSDRQARGKIMALVRATDGTVSLASVRSAVEDAAQRERALSGLIADGLVVRVRGGVRLPH